MVNQKITIEGLAKMIKEGFDNTATKAQVQHLEKKVDGLENKVDKIDERLKVVEEKVDIMVDLRPRLKNLEEALGIE